MEESKYEYPLPIGTTILGGYMSTADKERYQYRIDEILGQGGFGITYKVSSRNKIGNVWQRSRVTFAIKEHFVKGICCRGSDGISVEYSKASATEVEDSLKEFLKEGERLGKICVGCENIVNVNEVIQANNTAYYVMEYIEGDNLRKRGRLNEKEAVGYVCQIAKAVDYLHQQKVLHLDIKPDNVVLSQNPDGKLIPILIDFGGARYFSPKGRLTTTHKTIYASSGYAPLEQYLGIDKFSPEVDVYALGATLFYMLVGKEPYSASDRLKLPHGDIENALPETISEQTRIALLNAMKVQAFERTKTVAAFMSDLNAEPSVQENVTERLNFHVQPSLIKKRQIVIGGFAVIIVLLGILLFGSNPSDSSEVVLAVTELIDSVSTDTSVDSDIKGKEAKKTGDNIKKSKVEKGPSVQAEAQVAETDESIFSRASLNKDWNTIQTLARKGYTPACGLLARYYIEKGANQENHCRAFYWAQKATKKDKDYVINTLEKFGFLVDGEPVVPCDNIVY